MRTQALALVILILLSVAISKSTNGFSFHTTSPEAKTAVLLESADVEIAKQKSSISEADSYSVPRAPIRNWSFLDPEIQSEAVFMYSLNDNLPLFSFNTYKIWPSASLTKLMTAVIILEEVGKNKKIEITKEAIATEGVAGGLKEGDMYAVEDVLKIMLLRSSNDAAAAFEIFIGRDILVNKMNNKAKELGMTQTLFYDASGLSDLNVTSPHDMLILANYVITHDPEILTWTRASSVTLQAINSTESQVVYNINPLSKESWFLGGKTGTSSAAKENMLAIISLHDRKIVTIILGSRDRLKEIKNLSSWVEQAYNF